MGKQKRYIDFFGNEIRFKQKDDDPDSRKYTK